MASRGGDPRICLQLTASETIVFGKLGRSRFRTASRNRPADSWLHAGWPCQTERPPSVRRQCDATGSNRDGRPSAKMWAVPPSATSSFAHAARKEVEKGGRRKGDDYFRNTVKCAAEARSPPEK